MLGFWDVVWYSMVIRMLWRLFGAIVGTIAFGFILVIGVPVYFGAYYFWLGPSRRKNQMNWKASAYKNAFAARCPGLLHR